MWDAIIAQSALGKRGNSSGRWCISETGVFLFCNKAAAKDFQSMTKMGKKKVLYSVKECSHRAVLWGVVFVCMGGGGEVIW